MKGPVDSMTTLDTCDFLDDHSEQAPRFAIDRWEP